MHNNEFCLPLWCLSDQRWHERLSTIGGGTTSGSHASSRYSFAAPRLNWAKTELYHLRPDTPFSRTNNSFLSPLFGYYSKSMPAIVIPLFYYDLSLYCGSQCYQVPTTAFRAFSRSSGCHDSIVQWRCRIGCGSGFRDITIRVLPLSTSILPLDIGDTLFLFLLLVCGPSCLL